MMGIPGAGPPPAILSLRNSQEVYLAIEQFLADRVAIEIEVIIDRRERIGFHACPFYTSRGEE